MSACFGVIFFGRSSACTTAGQMVRQMCRAAVIALALACTIALRGAVAIQDPCADFGSHAKGDPFVIGVAYLPDSTVESWRAPDGTFYHPCRNKEHLKGAQISVYSVETDRITVARAPRLAEESAFLMQRGNITFTLPGGFVTVPPFSAAAASNATSADAANENATATADTLYGQPVPGGNISNASETFVSLPPLQYDGPATTGGTSMTVVVFQGTKVPVMSDPFVIRSTNPLLGMGRLPRLTLLVRLGSGNTMYMKWDIRKGT